MSEPTEPTGPTEPTLDQLAADRDQWRARALSMLEVLNEVEHLMDAPMVTVGENSTVSARRLQDLYLAFDAWRQLIEGGVPALWTVAGEGGAAGIEPDENEVPF